MVSQGPTTQISHFNNGTLALPYLTYLARPYDLELFFTEFGHPNLPNFKQLSCGHNHWKADSLRGWSCSKFAIGCNQGQSLLCENNVLRQKKVQSHMVAVGWLNRSSPKSHYYNRNFALQALDCTRQSQVNKCITCSIYSQYTCIANILQCYNHKLLSGDRCPPAPAVVNATSDGSAAEHGSVIMYTCIEGHMFSGGKSEMQVRCNAGKWIYNGSLYCVRE